MGLNPEVAVKIHDRAKRIKDESARKIAKAERAKTRFEPQRDQIKQELTEFNKLIAGDTELQQSLSIILSEKDGFKEFPNPDGVTSVKGLLVSNIGRSQLAVMTPNGLAILKENIVYRSEQERSRYVGQFSEKVFEPVNFDDAYLLMLFFSKKQFKVGQLADNIANIILKSPDKK